MSPDKHRIESARTRIILTGLVSLASTTSAWSAEPPRLGKATVKQVTAALTLEEKAALVVGEGMWLPPMFNADGTEMKFPESSPLAHQHLSESFKLVLGAAGTTYVVPRLGIGTSVLCDGPAGLRISATRPEDSKTYYCTAFPVATLLASTWDTELVGQVGRAMGSEVLEYGADVLLAPGMNIHRNPLCGRNFEYYSEDPLVAGKMAAAMVGGIQGSGVGTSIKHFAANNAETNRNGVNVHVSERALREIYLEGFRIAVQQAAPWTVMSSYNKINGTYASENPDLLTKVLRDDWGFKGYVMTDWFAGTDPVAHLQAGNDMIMPGNPKQRAALVQAVKDGRLDAKVLDQSVARFLSVLAQGPRAKGYAYSSQPDLKAHAAVTRQAASEGMVLLKNERAALPLGPEIKRIAAFGNTSYQIITGGTGSGDVNKAYSVSLIEGLQSVGWTLNEELKTLYTDYRSAVKAGRPKGYFWFMGEPAIAELEIPQDLAASIAHLADVAIITLGRKSGEGSDRTNVAGDFQLNESEQRLIQRVTAAFHAEKKKAIADILSGRVNPSGKLATTFVTRYEDVPSAKTFPGHEIPTDKPMDPSLVAIGFGKPAEDTYTDGIYVGYRYYDTFQVPTAYEFGYGLSYTSFGYENLKLSSASFSGKLTLSLDVKNTGGRPGKEAVQLYLTAPAQKLDKPAQELKGFAKTRLLAPGEIQTLSFTLDASSLASFDPAQSAWIAEAGQYEVKLGASSKDIRARASFTMKQELKVKQESVALVPGEKITELKAPARK